MSGDKLRNPGLILPAAVVAAMALSACSSQEEGDPAAANNESSAETSATLKFNDLGGGSSIIQVYPGVSEAADDKVYNGEYRHGDERPVECQTVGRLIMSDPSVGEDPRQSDVWYRLAGGDEDHYATAVYGDLVPPDANVPKC